MSDTIEGMRLFPCSNSKIALLLEQSKWLAELSREQFNVLSEYVKVYRVEKGGVIFQEGSSDRYLGVVVQGSILIAKKARKGIPKVIATSNPAQAFGEMSLVDGEPRSASAVAASDSIVLVITRERFQDLELARPILAFRLLWKISQLMSQRLRRTNARLLEFLDDPTTMAPEAS